MANTVHQASQNPTRKLSSATVAAAAMAVLGLALKNLAPEWYEPSTLASVTPVVIYIAGWFISDAPNIVVVTQDEPQ